MGQRRGFEWKDKVAQFERSWLLAQQPHTVRQFASSPVRQFASSPEDDSESAFLARLDAITHGHDAEPEACLVADEALSDEDFLRHLKMIGASQPPQETSPPMERISHLLANPQEMEKVEEAASVKSLQNPEKNGSAPPDGRPCVDDSKNSE